MAYRRSTHRLDYEARSKALLINCRKAERLQPKDRDVVEMVYQCAIFQTCAALETYLKLLIEGWAQEIRVRSLHACLPDKTRGFLAAKRFQPHFNRYAFAREETALSSAIANEHKTWPVLDSNSALPHYFSGALLHSETAYPTLKNIKRLFARVGVENIEHLISIQLGRDVDSMIEGFQSVRTALAHSAPPDVTMEDVRRLMSDISNLVQAIDRIFFKHVVRHGGRVCWNAPVT